MIAPSRYPADVAMTAACFIVDQLESCYLCVQVVGSLRRGKPFVHDVDLVMIPLLGDVPAAEPSLFQRTVKEPLVAGRLRDLAGRGTIADLSIGEKIIRFVHVATGVPFDIYLADERTWATLLLIRTGSRENNIRLCQRARELGYKLHADGRGIESADGSILHVTGERDLYFALDLPYQKPEER